MIHFKSALDLPQSQQADCGICSFSTNTERGNLQAGCSGWMKCEYHETKWHMLATIGPVPVLGFTNFTTYLNTRPAGAQFAGP